MKSAKVQRTNLRRQGGYYERLASEYLSQHGLTLVTQNFRCKLGEIDLIFKNKDSVIFVEVKHRKNLMFGSPLESVCAKKQQTIRIVAQYFLLTNPTLNLDPRFDVIGILHDPQEISDFRAAEITWVKHAF